MSPEQFGAAVLDWFDRHGRKGPALAAEHHAVPVWVSEIMLQQTQVSTVLGYFDRFMEALPTVEALAAAEEDEVLHLWTGLGYYSRARNLHKTAKRVVTEYGGIFPRMSTSSPSFPDRPIDRRRHRQHQHGSARAILDGNVKRVLARYVAQDGYPGEPKVARQLWEVAERLTPGSGSTFTPRR